jgi:hypothetical protein
MADLEILEILSPGIFTRSIGFLRAAYCKPFGWKPA